MDTEDKPLLVSSLSHDGSETSGSEDSDHLKDMVLFHGKENAGKSFIRSPNYNLVRIGVSRDGIFKLDGSTMKVLTHWKFREVRDSSYSGFSFTLQFRSGKSDYNVRTDDGEAICSYIEEFQKNPERALERLRNNPPVSKIPESGLMTLRRKFSGADHKAPQPQTQDVKFYTLNRKTTKKNSYDKLVHNIEVDSRLRNKPLKGTPLNGHDLLENRRSYSFEGRHDAQIGSNVTQCHSVSDIHRMNGGVVKNGSPEKNLARAVLSQRIKQAEEKEKRQSFNASPVSTKGEVTTTESTKASSSPVLNKRWSANSPKQQRKALPSHMSEFSKAGSAPPCLPPDEKEGGVVPGVISKAHGMKQLDTVGKSKSPPTLMEGTQKKERPPAPDPVSPSSEQAPLISNSLSSSGGLDSSADEFTFLPAGSDGSRLKRPISGADSLTRSSSGSNQNYDHLEEFVSKKHSSWESFSTSESTSPAPAFSLPPAEDDEASSRNSSRLSNCSSNESGTYDHLPPSEDKNENLFLNVSEVPRRNISQPALSTPPSARESPCDQFGRFGSIDEESSGEELGATPTNSDDEGSKETKSEEGASFEGVMLRQKKKQHLEDPFAALLSPKASGRLRWSQELNPLYDYIKGFKAEGVRLYDSSPASNLLQSTSVPPSEGGTPAKPPSIILEVEGEQDDLQSCGVSEDLQSCELSEDTQSVGSQDTQSMWSQDTQSMWSQDSQSVWSQDAMMSPTSPSFSEGGSGLGIPLKSRAMHNYEDVMPLPRKAHHGHNYEDINNLTSPGGVSSMPNPPSPISNMDRFKRSDTTTGVPSRTPAERFKQKQGLKSSSMLESSTAHQRYREMAKAGVSPRLGKRELIQQRRSRTIAAHDDSEAVKTKQRPVKVADAFKDFSFVMREFRLFYVKLPNGFLAKEIFSINKPICELRDRICDYLGIDTPDQYQLSVEGACLSTLRENEAGAEVVRVNRVGLNYLVDSHILPDQGTDPIILKANLSFRIQGISTTRILALRPVAPDDTLNVSYSLDPPSEEDEYHKCWISVVQGNLPLTQEKAVKLAALQYQAYFLDRTAVNSVVGFSRPTEFLPVEYTSVRGVEQKMYKEQEALLKKTHLEIEDMYIEHCTQLETFGAVFFPAREPRKKLLQSTKLKPIIFGVGPRGILRVDPKTKELLGFWHYNVLKNWAYSKRTFVLAFRDKSFPVESNQAKWISTLVDFFVDSLVLSRTAMQSKAS